MLTRSEKIAQLRQQPQISVLIIGAGINGLGTFRDLALQGVDVLLVDKGDFCSGASAASTRQAHGGLRYLENGEFRLVRESLVERNRLLRNAPHAVELQPYTIPVFSWLSGLLNAPLKFVGLLKKPNKRGYLVAKLGMLFYDWLTRRDSALPRHRMLNRAQVLDKHRGLNPKVIGAATYYDCRIPQAERLGVELALDAEAAFEGARALTYCPVIGAADDQVRLRDELSGEEFTVRPRLVINATGAWIDLVNRALNQPTHLIGGTKGSHLIVDHRGLSEALAGSVLFFENTDNRLVILVPFYDKVMIGTSDIRIDDPDQARCTAEEIDYFLAFTRQMLPGLSVERSHIVYQFSGVRPLPSAQVEFAGLVSRDHSIQVKEPDSALSFPIYSLVGGKWTTFRAFAEQVTDKALAYLDRARRLTTGDRPIGGGVDYPHDSAEEWIAATARSTGLSAERVRVLFSRYGTRASTIATYIAAGPDEPLAAQPSYSTREIGFLAAQEQVEHLGDVLLRRSVLAMRGLVDGALLIEVGQVVGAALGWSPARIEGEIARTAEILITQHGVAPEKLGRPTPQPEGS